MKTQKTGRVVTLLILCLFTLGVSAGIVSGQVIKIENKIPQNAPIKIEFKNQDLEDWVHGLEILVTNTGKKPIHFLSLFLLLDVRAEDGTRYGFSFHFGNKTLVSTESLATDADQSILPNETYTFKIRKDTADAWTNRKTKGNFIEPQISELTLGWLSFGDGTGIKPRGTTYKKKT